MCIIKKQTMEFKSYWQIKDEIGNPFRPQKTMFLISGFFDPLTNRSLQTLINDIAEETGNHFMIENQVPPHLTFLQVQTRSQQDELIKTFSNLENRLYSLPVTFTAFGGEIPNVVYAKVKLSDELKNQLNIFYNAVSQIADLKVNPHYLPENFFPHITLGKTLDRKQQEIALSLLNEKFTMFSGRLNEWRLSCGKPPVYLSTI